MRFKIALFWLLLLMPFGVSAVEGDSNVISRETVKAWVMEALLDVQNGGLSEGRSEVEGDAYGQRAHNFMERERQVDEDIEHAVVKVHTDRHEFDYSTPWKSPDQAAATGTGFVIVGKRIMTNAHVVANHSSVRVTHGANGKKFLAKVEHINHECDLAILKVGDESFFDAIQPLEFGEFAKKMHPVKIYGYQAGGDTLSITQAHVSRTELNHYAHTSSLLLTSQVDTSYNPGNSGGPVLSDIDGKVVGVAFQGFETLKNTDAIIPIPIINHFLELIKRGKSAQEFPILGVTFQETRNPALRTKHLLNDDGRGALVAFIHKNSTANGILQVDDVVTKIDGYDVSDDLQVTISKHLQVGYQYVISSKFVDEALTVEFIRDGQIHTVTIPLKYSRQDYQLVMRSDFDKKPSYYIYAGLVFQPLTRNCLGNGRDGTAAVSLEVFRYLEEEKKSLDHEAVFLNKVLTHEVNEGYDGHSGGIVKKLNGVEPHNLRHFIELIEANRGAYQVIEFANHNKLVVDHAKALNAKSEILESYYVPAERSGDLW